MAHEFLYKEYAPYHKSDDKQWRQDNNKILRKRIMEKHVDALHRFGKIRKDIRAIVISNISRNKRVAKNCCYTKYR